MAIFSILVREASRRIVDAGVLRLQRRAWRRQIPTRLRNARRRASPKLVSIVPRLSL
jgi:hypothetical protein